MYDGQGDWIWVQRGAGGAPRSVILGLEGIPVEATRDLLKVEGGRDERTLFISKDEGVVQEFHFFSFEDTSQAFERYPLDPDVMETWIRAVQDRTSLVCHAWVAITSKSSLIPPPTGVDPD